MKNTKTLVMTALFVAIVCVCTAAITFPSGTGGYLHPGDGAVLLSAYLLGPVYGTIAAGVGSALADLFLGYTVYAPGTLIIKALVALVAALLARALKRTGFVRYIIAGVIGEAVMVCGYFVYEYLVLGDGGAAAGILGNIQQAVAGIVISVILIAVFEKNSYLKKMIK